MRQVRLVVLALLAMLAAFSPAAAAPEGQMTWGVHVSLAPTWFDPAETQGIITPFMVMYAIHDALVKAMPGNAAARIMGSRTNGWSSSAASSTVTSRAFHYSPYRTFRCLNEEIEAARLVLRGPMQSQAGSKAPGGRAGNKVHQHWNSLTMRGKFTRKSGRPRQPRQR